MPWAGWPLLPQQGSGALLLGRGPPQTPAPRPPIAARRPTSPMHMLPCADVGAAWSGPLPCPDLPASLPSPRTERRTREHRKHPVLSFRRGPKPGAGRTAGCRSLRCPKPPRPAQFWRPGSCPQTGPTRDPFIKRRGDSTFRWTRPAAWAPWPGAAVQSRVRGCGGRRPRESCARIKGAAGSGARCGRVSASRAPCSRPPPRRACAAAGRAPAGCTAWAARSTSRLWGA